MKIKLNVINRDGAKSAIEVDEGTTIRNAIEDKIDQKVLDFVVEIVTVARVMFILI